MQVEVSNDLDFNRNEIVSIPLEHLKGIDTEELKYLHVQDAESKKYQRTQFMDSDADGEIDSFYFRQRFLQTQR